MTITYYVKKEDAQKLMADGNLSTMCIDGFEELEIDIDCNSRRVTIYGMDSGNDVLLDDNAYAYIPAIDEVAEGRGLGDYYILNVEVAKYLELLDIPYQWALESVDEWRNPDDEEKPLKEGEFWEVIDGILAAWEISREEN